MTQKTDGLLVVTNLYPVPWAPNRASFNKQQFDLLAREMPVYIIVLIPWLEWFKHKKQWHSQDNIKPCPYFYLPKIGRRFVPLFQKFALKQCLPWIKSKSLKAILASWGFPDAVAVTKLNKQLNLPLFVKVHGTDVNENCQVASRAIQMKQGFDQANQVFCASRALADELEKIGVSRDKLNVNYNGVNPAVFYPSAESKVVKRLVFVGSLIPTKGVSELLEAFLAVYQNDASVSIDIIGSGPMSETILAWIKQHQLENSVNFLGSLPLPEVAAHIRKSALLVLPSYREGVPNVVLESFASGTPVVSTTVGGIPEVVNDKVGLLVKPKNSIELARAIEQALATEWQEQDILSHASAFDWQRNIENVKACIEAS